MDNGDFVVDDVELSLGLSNASNCVICRKEISFVSSAMKSNADQKVIAAAATAASLHLHLRRDV